MRPEVSALRELDTLVRNLTEQLAGYRRRALAAEARSRELEQQLAEAAGKLAEVRAAREQERAGHDAAVLRARQLEEQLVASRAETVRVSAELHEAVLRATPEARDTELARENERLRVRLTDARDRASQLGDRIRFLRQQVALGVEK